MSEYVIHNISLEVTLQLNLFNEEENDKPVSRFPNYYLGKIIGDIGNVLDLKRLRRGNIIENVPNCVLRNNNGIALIRIHNKEAFTVYGLPDNTDNIVKDCTETTTESYPYAYVVVDYRDERCQLAIEKNPSWDSKTITIKNSLEEFFNNKLSKNLGITTRLNEKTITTKFEDFIDQRTIDYGDVIESFTFKYVNLKRYPNARIPEGLTNQIVTMSKVLEMYDAISGITTMNMGDNVDKEKLKQLSTVITYSADNAYDLIVKLRDYGDYTCNEDIIAKYPMNDIVTSNFRDNVIPDIINSEFDLKSWLDDVFEKVKKGKYDEEIPAKPM